MALKRIGVQIATQTVPIQLDHAVTVPTTFLPFDSNVSTADRYVNIRDEVIKRQNHNVLIANRCKRNIGHFVLGGAVGFPVGQRLPVDAFFAAPEMFIPLYLSQWTKSIQVVIRCCQRRAADGDDHDPQIACVLCRHGDTRRVPASAIQSITTAHTLTEADLANYTWTVTVPGHTAESAVVMGQLLFDLYILAYAPRNDVADSTGTAITGWTESSITAAGIVAGPGYVLKVGTDYRMVQASLGSNEYHVDAPWSGPIDISTATVDVYRTLAVDVFSVSIYELNTTSFLDLAGEF